MKDVIITGGRDYTDYDKIEAVLQLLDVGLLIQGGATGADALARTYAGVHHIDVVTCSANWGLHGRAAGPIRNGEMLDKYPNAVVVAFPGGRGTQDCVRQAVSKGRLVLSVSDSTPKGEKA